MNNITDLVSLTKPVRWSKTFSLVILGAVMASRGIPDVMKLALLCMAAGPFLWGGLYALNDITDLELDRMHKEKKERPIASGKVSVKAAAVISFVLVTLGLVLTYSIAPGAVAPMLLMAANQVLYTARPFRLKEKLVFDILSGGFLNTFFRFAIGWYSFAPQADFPLVFVASISCITGGGYAIYRAGGRNVDAEANFRSTIIKIKENVKYLSGALIFIVTPALFALSSLKDEIPRVSLAILPLYFLGVYLTFIPVIRKPEYRQMEEIEKKTYALSFAVAVFFALTYLLK